MAWYSKHSHNYNYYKQNTIKIIVSMSCNIKKHSAACCFWDDLASLLPFNINAHLICMKSNTCIHGNIAVKLYTGHLYRLALFKGLPDCLAIAIVTMLACSPIADYVPHIIPTLATRNYLDQQMLDLQIVWFDCQVHQLPHHWPLKSVLTCLK